MECTLHEHCYSMQFTKWMCSSINSGQFGVQVMGLCTVNSVVNSASSVLSLMRGR